MNVRLGILAALTGGLAVVVIGGLASCGPPAIDGGFDSANPAAKMYAIEYAAKNRDRSAIPRIVEQLDSDDPAVRSLAISALARITGKTYGYCDLDTPEQRRVAIERWVQAINAGEFTNDNFNGGELNAGELKNRGIAGSGNAVVTDQSLQTGPDAGKLDAGKGVAKSHG